MLIEMLKELAKGQRSIKTATTSKLVALVKAIPIDTILDELLTQKPKSNEVSRLDPTNLVARSRRLVDDPNANEQVDDFDIDESSPNFGEVAPPQLKQQKYDIDEILKDECREKVKLASREIFVTTKMLAQHKSQILDLLIEETSETELEATKKCVRLFLNAFVVLKY